MTAGPVQPHAPRSHRPFVDAASAQPRLRLATYNIRKAVGLDWRRDPHRTLRVINALGADVVALQEADKRLGARHAALPQPLIKAESDFDLVPLARSPVSLGWHGNAILVREDFGVRETRVLALPGIEPRGCVLARLGTPAGEVTVVGVHLGLRRGCRRLQFSEILSALEPEERARAVIMGDFNEWSLERGLEGIVEDFALVTPGKSFHAARPMAYLDRFALGPGIRLLASGVEAGRDARIASDHLPVWADITFA